MKTKANRYSWLGALRVGQFFTPRGFVVSAFQIAVVYLLFHVAGFRECTTVFIGAMPGPGVDGRVAAGLGLAYILFYLAFTVLVPILLIAAGLWKVGAVLRLLAVNRRLPSS